MREGGKGGAEIDGSSRGCISLEFLIDPIDDGGTRKVRNVHGQEEVEGVAEEEKEVEGYRCALYTLLRIAPVSSSEARVREKERKRVRLSDRDRHVQRRLSDSLRIFFQPCAVWRRSNESENYAKDNRLH